MDDRHIGKINRLKKNLWRNDEEKIFQTND
jgi:hypothetical protein